MLFPKLDLHSVEPLALWDFCNIFPPTTGEDQKHVISERGASGTVACANPYLVIALRS